MTKIYGQYDLETIEKLADIVEKKQLSEITLTSGSDTITIKGKRPVPPPPAAMPMPFMGAPMPMPAPAQEIQPAAEQNIPSPAASADEGIAVKSPIVGTFYAAPSPDKPPFVKVGDTVKKGDVIMIIESMKLMNEIQSEYDGTVEKILVTDGQAVEYDQPVMILK